MHIAQRLPQAEGSHGRGQEKDTDPMAGTRQLSIKVVGDAKGAVDALKEVDGQTEKTGSAFGKMGGVIAAAGGAAALVGFGKGAFDAAMESQKIAAQTEAVIKSTGGAANVTADSLDELVTSLSKKNAVDDEAIQQGSNLLLTFTNIKNEAGEGNDVFNQANQIMVDMAAAMGTDVKGGAIQLGKALNDPVAGISALSRVGVTFTDEQKNMIKAMVEAGDVAGAQKVILNELGKEFGGSAAAQATATDRMKIAFGNLQEEIGARLIPVVERVAAWIVESGIPALERFAGFVNERVVPVVQEMGRVVGEVIGFLADWWRDHWDQIREGTQTAIEAVRNIIDTVTSAIRTIWAEFGDNILGYIDRTWQNISRVVEGAINIVRGVIQTVTALIRGDWGEVWEGIQRIVSGAWDVIRGLVGQAIEEVRLRFEAAIAILGAVWRRIWEPIENAIAATKDWIGARIGEVIGFITDMPDRIGNAAAGMWDGIRDAFRDTINWIIDGWNGLSFSLPEVDTHIPGVGKVGGWTLGTPDIPRLAMGGIVSATPGGRLIIAGEAGEDEAIVPLSKMPSMIQPTSSGVHYHFHVDRLYASRQDAEQFGDRASVAFARAQVARRINVDVRGTR